MFKALLKKQFLELFSFYFTNKKTGKSRAKSSTISMLVLYSILMVFVGVMFGFLAYQLAVYFLEINYDWLYFAMMGLMAVFLGVFGGVFNTYAGLYHAKDNELLLSMPIEPSKILFVRMIGVYAIGFMYESIVIIPAVIVYWLIKTPTFLSVLFPVLLVFIIGFLVLTLTCALGWVVAIISSKLKNKSYITVILSLAFIALYYFVYYNLNNLLQLLTQNAESIGNVMRSGLYPFYQLGLAASGDILGMLIFTAIVGALFALTYYVLSKSFIRITTTNKGAKKKVYREKTAKASGSGVALLSKEFKRFLNSPTYMLNCGFGVVFLVFITIFAIIKTDWIRSIIFALNISDPNLVQMVPIVLCAAVCMLVSMNPISAPSISLEGKNIWILQSMPVETHKILLSKQGIHIIVNGLSALFATVTVGFIARLSLLDIVICSLFAAVFVLFTAAAGVALNLAKPNLDWKNETVPIKQNMSVLILLFGGWVLLIGYSVGYFFLLGTIQSWVYSLLCTALIAAVTVALNHWIKTKGTVIFENL